MPGPGAPGPQNAMAPPFPQMSPEQERANLCFLVLERVPYNADEKEVAAMRATAAKYLNDFFTKPIGNPSTIWAPTVAQA